MPNDTENQREKLLQLVRDVVQHDKTLREQYQVGDKFRFIRDRLQALLTRVEEQMTILQQESEQKIHMLGEDEALVYVYLFNAQGLAFNTWQKMLNPSVFYEYSINRPIYADKTQVEAFIRSKPNKVQHAYLTVAVKKVDILQSPEPLVDAMGNPIVKVKEGALRADHLIAFTHNAQDYVLNEDREIVKKE